MATIEVKSPNVSYTNDFIQSKYVYQNTKVDRDAAGNITATPVDTEYLFRTQRQVPKLGVMLVGWGGNNGSTITATILANKHNIDWPTKDGLQKPNYFGSITQASTVLLGTGPEGEVYVPMKSLLPMVDPNDLVLDGGCPNIIFLLKFLPKIWQLWFFIWFSILLNVIGWDISSKNLADSMERARVLDYNLQTQLKPYMENFKPRPSIYIPEFIAANQAERADNVLTGSKQEMMTKIREDIREFKKSSGVDKVIVLWTANTERFSEVIPGLNDTAENLISSIRNNESEVSPSTLFAVASILEGVSTRSFRKEWST